MKIIHRLIGAYLAIALVMSGAGYLSVKIYSDIKTKIVHLQKDPIRALGQSEELLTTIENCQKAVQTLIAHKPAIVYSYADTQHEADAPIQVEEGLKADLDKVEAILTPFMKFPSFERLEKIGAEIDAPERDLKDWLELRKKHFYYHWKYLSYFINLTDELPDQAFIFFEKTLEPHYRKNIYPIINSYRKGEQDAKEKQFTKIIEEYIPNARRIIISSTLISLCSVFLLSFWISHSISKPLNKLTRAALTIGRGNLETRIDITSKDEVGILADAFNRMTNDLSKTTVSKSYVDNIIKSMLDTLIVVDAQARIIKVNKSTLNLLGYRRQELVGKPIRDIILDETRQNTSLIDTLLFKRSIANVEKTYVTKTGAKIPVLLSGAVMHDDQGAIQGIVCVARDISDRKKNELALQRAYAEMEHRVEERTADLVTANQHLQREIEERRRTEAALRESENRLRHLSSHILSAQEKERQRLSMELHDDLGQSLSLLKVQLSAVQRKLGGAKVRLRDAFVETCEYLDFIIENVRRLSRDLSPSILEDLGLTAALERLIEDFSKHYGICPHVGIENIDHCFSRENSIIIYRIFQEIFTNIGKHARAEDFSVRISRQDAAVTFWVEDNGKGFDRVAPSSQRTPERGIGLAAMEERAVMLGSRLALSSRPGQGTRIVFSVAHGKRAIA